MAEPHTDGVFIRRDFLPPLELAKLLGVFDRLEPHWASSQALGLLGRAGTMQLRASDIATQARLDEVRRALALPVLRWARNCGFRLSPAPYLQLFPVRMVGDAAKPAYQEPHVDSDASQSRPPVCTSVFYARVRATQGGALAARRGADLSDPITVTPTANALVTFAGDRVHWVQPLLAGERLSVVINFY
jgi:2OG-Fe(II) oxygenase superfamily